MEDQSALAQLDVPSGNTLLTELIAQFLEAPDPSVEHKLSQFSGDHYLSILADSSQPRNVQIVCCSALKEALLRRDDFGENVGGLLGSIEALYLSGSENISNLLETVIERVFQMYLDDDKKLSVFERVIDRLSASNDIRQSEINKRAINLSQMLVRAMAVSTLNNQICVGALICYLKQVYYPQHMTNQEWNPNGRGGDLLLQALGARELQGPLLGFVGLQTQVVKLLKEIIQRVEEQEHEETVIPAEIMRGKQIENLLMKMICLTDNGCIYALNDTVNELKAELLEIYILVYQYHLPEPFLLSALATITSTQAIALTDHSSDIAVSLLLLLERSTSFPKYANTFYNNTQILILKLFQFIAAKEAEKDCLLNDPQHFSEIADDFCKTQESDSLKCRAGSLLYNLCMYIDGNLTYITNFSFIALNDLERKASLTLNADAPLRPQVVQSEPPLKTLLDLWGFGAESLTQTSILVLSSISDLLNKRYEFKLMVRQHLSVMFELFRKEGVWQFFPVMVICRYIQLVSFFSGPGCLDPFIPLFDFHQGVAQSILKALETVIHYHDKDNQNMGNYVSTVSSRIMLLSQKLNPLLENTIILRPQLLLCVKQKLIQKLVLWLLNYFENQNIFGCNKIGNLLCKVIEQYPNYLSHTDQLLKVHQLQALAQYLAPLYKGLVNGEHITVQEAVVDVAVAHAEILQTSLTQELASNFMKIGITVVDRNKAVLNKCLELFSQLLGVAHMKKSVQSQEYQTLRKVNLWVGAELLKKINEWLDKVEVRNENIWQLLMLVQIILGTYEATMEPLDPELLQLPRLFILCDKCNSGVLKVKALVVSFLKMRLGPTLEMQQWVQKQVLPNWIPPYQKDHLCIYLLRSYTSFSIPELKAYLLQLVLRFMMPNEQTRKYFSTYEDRVHVIGGSDECEVFAFQTAKDVRHPLFCWPSDVFQELRTMVGMQRGWPAIRPFLSQEDEQRIKAALEMHQVGSQIRRIVRTKKLKL